MHRRLKHIPAITARPGGRLSAARAEPTDRLRQGTAREQIQPGGVPRFPAALSLLPAGTNTGTLVLKVAG